MQFWMEVIRSALETDVVILDTPPCLMVTDSSVLAATAQAEVLLIIDCGRTRHRSAQKPKEQFTHFGVTVRGLILNRINPLEEVSNTTTATVIITKQP